MLDDALHSGNILVLAAVAAADVSTLGMASAGVGIAMSTRELARKLPKELRGHGEATAERLEQRLANSHATEDQKKHVRVMIGLGALGADEIVAANKSAQDMVEAMLLRVASNTTDPAYLGQTIHQVFRDNVTPVLNALMVDKAISEALRPHVENAVLQEIRAVKALLEQGDVSGQFTRMRDEGITEKAIQGLVRNSAAQTDDLQQAWQEVQNLVRIAIEVQQRGRTTSNHPDFIDEVLTRAAALSAEGDHKGAEAQLIDALAEEEAQHKAKKTRLLTAAADEAILANDAEAAAAHLWAAAQLDLPAEADAFNALRTLRRTYYERGRDKGIALDLRIAIALARLSVDRAVGPDQRGTALNDLAIALFEIGNREATITRLEEAVTAYREALKEGTQDRVPLNWATTQNNLGNALATLGQRAGDTDLLQQAVTAYQEALEERTQDRVPLDWAMTQNNLGNALATLGQRAGDTDPLQQAVTAYREALKERTQDRVPLDWAMTQNNLGNALATLGERAGDTDLLQQAVTAFNEALKERTQDRVPLNWAGTQSNLADLYRAKFDLTGDVADLDLAQSYLDAARAVFAQPGAEGYLAMADNIQAAIDARR